MIDIQASHASALPSALLARRLSMVQGVAQFGPTAQSLLEAPKPAAKAWNSNYGSHGWHRYVGRFPPHVVRALLNYFQASPSTPVCDPFVGSGTSAVECRLLGIPFIGVEICPLSSLMTRTKSTFPSTGQPLRDLATRYARSYKSQWAAYSTSRTGRIVHSSVLERSGNPIPEFPNVDKWFTAEALLGASLTVEYAMSQVGFLRSALLLALSAKMRSIGNVDVDVVRAEYRRQPRTNVDVCKLVVAQLNTMARDIDASTASHEGLIGSPDLISLHEASVLDVTLAPRSVEFVITSPPYGVEVISYLRTHLLSYRALVAELDHDPYDTRDKTIGSEYIPNELARQITRVERRSQTFAAFFQHLARTQEASLEPRRLAMMHFFDDMLSVGERFREWLVPKGKIAFIIGNKRLGTEVIPAQDIIRELFDACGLAFVDAVSHKLKTNNSNSQVPWQDRIIQDEAILFFERRS
jgi:hypothetical protein